MNYKNLNRLLFVIFFSLIINACRENYDYIEPGTSIDRIQNPENNAIKGLYILNEGNMGTNKASIDYFDYRTGIYHSNYYAGQNPSLTGSLGDVGNDIMIYRDKLFAVINSSNYVQVMEAKTTKHIGDIKIQNCRNINFYKNYAYITSYGGAVGLSQAGYVVKVDLNTLNIVDTLSVGLQPDGLEVVGDKLYVANSGGYKKPHYDNTISVIDLNTFTEVKKIQIGINPGKIKKDNKGNLWVISRGNYEDIAPKVYILDPKTETIIKVINQPISNFSLVENKLYYYAYQWSSSGVNSSYGIYNADDYSLIDETFIKNGIEKEIVIPYGIAVNPLNGDIFLADAKDYQSPGEIFCFDKSGTLKWRKKSGDIPAHFVFLYE